MRKFLMMGALVAVGCQHRTAASLRDFIPGVYVKQSESEYSKAYDTLRISVYDAAGNTYLVLQRTGYQMVREGKLQPKQYKNAHEIAVYDESTHQLQGMETGRWLIFSSEKNTVFYGSAEYSKLKE